MSSVSWRDSSLRTMRRFRWLWLGAVAGLALIAGAMFMTGTRPDAVPGSAAVRRGTITASVQATGQVRSAREVQLSLPMGGQITAVLVRAGDKVTEGQVLLRLDPSEAERRVREAELQLEARQEELDKAKAGPSDADINLATANLRQATVALQLAQSAYDKVAGQADAGKSPEALTLENAKMAEMRARAEFDRAVNGPTPEDLAWAETQVKLAELGVEQARTGQAQTELAAPFAGTVTRVQADAGENAGGYSPLITLADLNQVEIRANIDEVDVADVAPDQPVDVRLDAFPGRVLNGRVERVSPAATTDRGATQFEAIVSLLSSDPNVTDILTRLKLGMGANLNITTVQKAGVLLVPSRAVQSIGRNKVVKVVEDGQPREVVVTVGVSNGNQTEVVDGLRDGQTVVVQ